MCHASDDEVPVAASPGAARPGTDLTLRAADGNEFLAYHAPALNPKQTGVVVMPTANGLVPFFKELCERFAEHGYSAIGMDYYGRTAGLGARADEPKIYPENMPKVRPETADLDVAAASAYLLSTDAGQVSRVVSVGFCFAGAMSWRQSARGLAGAVGFYGCAEDLRASVPDLRTLTSPMLLLVAGADKVYPPDDLMHLDRELADAGVPHRTVRFDGAPHGFFRRCDEWQAECDHAWNEVLAFLGQINSS